MQQLKSQLSEQMNQFNIEADKLRKMRFKRNMRDEESPSKEEHKFISMQKSYNHKALLSRNSPSIESMGDSKLMKKPKRNQAQFGTIDINQSMYSPYLLESLTTNNNKF